MIAFLSQHSVYSLPFPSFSSAFKNLEGERVHRLLPVLLTHPAADTPEHGQVVCSQIAPLAPRNTGSWHRTQQLSEPREHTAKGASVLVILIPHKAQPL